VLREGGREGKREGRLSFALRDRGTGAPGLKSGTGTSFIVEQYIQEKGVKFCSVFLLFENILSTVKYY
jgi:hypothetical protein